MKGYCSLAGLGFLLVGLAPTGAGAFVILETSASAPGPESGGSRAEAFKPHSKAARAPEVSKFLEKYSFVRFRHALHAPMPIQAGSLAAGDHQFGLIIMDLRFLNAPAFANALEAPLKRFKIQVEADLARIGGYAFEKIADGGFSSEAERRTAILEVASHMETDFSGLLGELYMAAALPGSLRISTKVRDNPELMAVIDKLRPVITALVLASPAELGAYERDFPMLFWSPVEKIPMSEPLQNRLSRIWDRILNEEIDVFRISGGEYFIGESKVSSKPFDAESFAKKAGFAHTRGEQAESKRQLAKLLSRGGIKVNHEYMVSAGFEKSLAAELTAKGWILHSPPPCTLLAEGQGE